MIEAAEIERMSKSERIQAMELLWDSLSSNPSELESPGWHGDVLAQRLAKMEAGEGEFLTVAQLKERLNRRSI